MTTIVKCPSCKNDVKWNTSSSFRPFCSKRCRLIDLGEWASESHSIHGETLAATEDIAALMDDEANKY